MIKWIIDAIRIRAKQNRHRKYLAQLMHSNKTVRDRKARHGLRPFGMRRDNL